MTGDFLDNGSLARRHVNALKMRWRSAPLAAQQLIQK